MTNKITPMLHVPEVAATIKWYESIGFKTRATHQEEGCELDWAALTFGESEIMLSAGGAPSKSPRRSVDLYIRTDELEKLRRQIPASVEIVEDIHETFYGMREFILRDLNGFWITFGQPAAK